MDVDAGRIRGTEATVEVKYAFGELRCAVTIFIRSYQKLTTCDFPRLTKYVFIAGEVVSKPNTF